MHAASSTFYEGNQFPAEYKGDIFAAEHGSWNKSMRAGYEVVRVPLENGHATGIYEDFITDLLPRPEMSGDGQWESLWGTMARFT